MNPNSSISQSSVPEILQRFEQELLEAADARAVLARYLALHSDMAERLREIAEAIELLQATPFHRADDLCASLTDSSKPARFGPYRVIRSIGRGGMGEVYEAVEEPLQRRVAVKTIRRSQTTSAHLLLRFDRERRTLARLHHTNIVPIFATGREGDLLYFAMPYLSGASLGQVIKTARSHESTGNGLAGSSFEDLLKEAHSRSQSVSGAAATAGDARATAAAPEAAKPTQPPAGHAPASGSRLLSAAYIRTAVQVMAAVAEGVHHAHEAGVIHRDLKPTNIMVETGGHAWVLDFGLAALKAGDGGAGSSPMAWAVPPIGVDAELSLTAGPLGTLPYMAPEQHADGKHANVQSDVWGLGVTLYELLTLQRAFLTGEAVLSSEPVSPRALNPALDRDLDAIVLKALRKDPTHRYPNAQALADDLRHWLASEPVTARKTHTLRRLGLWARRNKGWAAAMAVTALSVLALTSIGLILAYVRTQHAEARAEHAIALQAEAEKRERIRQREVLIQDLQRIRILPHGNGWQKEIKSRIIEAKQLGGGDDNSLRTQAIASLRELDASQSKDLPYPASHVAFDPQGRWLYSCWSRNHVIRVWNSEIDETRTLTLKGHGPFAFHPDGTPLQLAEVDKDGRTLVLHDLAREAVRRRFTSPRTDRPFFADFAITPSGSHVAAIWQAHKPQEGIDPPADGPPVLIVVWEAATGALVRTIEHRAPAVSLAIAPDGRMLAVGDTQGNVAVWTLPNGNLYANLSASDNRIQCLAFGREPRVSYRQKPDIPAWQLAVGDGGGIVAMLDLQNMRIRNTCRGSSHDIKALAFRSDGAVLVSVGRYEGRLWDVATGRLVLSVGAGNTLPTLALSQNGRRLAVGRSAGFRDTDGVRIFDLRVGRGMQSLLGLQAKIERKEFSRDGRLIAALSDDFVVGIWDRRSGLLRHLFTVPPGFFADNAWMAFDPTARRFACSAGEHATLWDLETGRLLQTWPLRPGLQDHLAFHGPKELFLFRSETRDGAPPFDVSHPKDHPRVYRLYNLLGPLPLRPLKEIGDHDWHCFRVVTPADGRFLLAYGTGVKDGRVVRNFIAYDGRTGQTLWSLPPDPDPRGHEHLFAIDPTGAILVILHAEADSSTWLKLPSREWIADTTAYPSVLAPGGNRWFSLGSDRATQKHEWHYFPEGQKGTEIALTEKEYVHGTLTFGPDGRHVAWGGSDLSVVVCDLAELQRAMAEYGLGW
jgi:serine/threonine protein kinase/WD40 repeat protein